MNELHSLMIFNCTGVDSNSDFLQKWFDFTEFLQNFSLFRQGFMGNAFPTLRSRVFKLVRIRRSVSTHFTHFAIHVVAYCAEMGIKNFDWLHSKNLSNLGLSIQSARFSWRRFRSFRYITNFGPFTFIR